MLHHKEGTGQHDISQILINLISQVSVITCFHIIFKQGWRISRSTIPSPQKDVFENMVWLCCSNTAFFEGQASEIWSKRFSHLTLLANLENNITHRSYHMINGCTMVRKFVLGWIILYRCRAIVVTPEIICRRSTFDHMLYSRSIRIPTICPVVANVIHTYLSRRAKGLSRVTTGEVVLWNLW